MTRCPEQLDVAAFVLGVLEPVERQQLRVHIGTCNECAHELAALSDLPLLLARVQAESTESPPVVPNEVAFQRLRAATAQHQNRRSRRARGIVAVAAGILVLAAAGTALTRSAAHHPPHALVVAAAAGSVHARATLSVVETGTRITLSLTGVRAEERCQLVAVAADGHRETASTWTVTYSGKATVTGTVSLRPAEIRRLVVETLNGRELLTLPAPNA